MELRQLHVFLVLAKELHFGRTADRLGITPSYVSQLIRTLEEHAGGRLFDRTSRRVRLTSLGEQLLNDASAPYEQLQRAIRRANEATVGVAGVLRIGMYSGHLVGGHILGIVALFKSRHPAAEVVFVNTGLARNYLDVLRGGEEIEMFAARLPLSDADLRIGPVLSREDRVLVVARGDPLAGRDSVTLEDFADRAVWDVPAWPREMVNALVPPVTPSGRRYRRTVSATIDEVLMRIALGEQVHPTVSSFLEHHTHPVLTAVPIRDLPPSETALVWVKDNDSAKVRAFVHAATDYLAQTDLRAHQPPDQIH